MSSVGEALDLGGTPLSDSLAAGVTTLSLNQTIEFSRYVRVVLPIDGFAFWVLASLVSPGALFNATLLNAKTPNAPPKTLSAAKTLSARGSLHYATETLQGEEETYAKNRVVFTSLDEVLDLNEIGPGELYLATFEGVRFAFSSRSPFYRQANLNHYVGDAVYADVESTIVDDPAFFDGRLVVSNSLPIWLSFNGYVAKPFELFGNPSLRLYPSYLSPNNLRPPFAVVHVYPDATKPLAIAPTLYRTATHRQLSRDRVKVTFWGVRNDAALDFVDFVSEQSVNYDLFGFMNSPIVRDEKRPQSELNVISIKKSVEFEISYYQTRVNDLARQLILEAIPSYRVGDQSVA